MVVPYHQTRIRERVFIRILDFCIFRARALQAYLEGVKAAMNMLKAQLDGCNTMVDGEKAAGSDYANLNVFADYLYKEVLRVYQKD